MIFDQAAVIAGFAGSGLFTMMFTELPKPVIIISSTSYTARNEYLIASAIGHDLTVIYSVPDIHHPRGGGQRGVSVALHLRFRTKKADISTRS